MSRIGRMPITVPAGVTVTVADGNVVTVKGPLGTLTEKFNSRMTIKQEGAEIVIVSKDEAAASTISSSAESTRSAYTRYTEQGN